MNVLNAKIGDILSCTWGYSMTIVDFYKVIKVSPSGKSVTVQRLASDCIEGHAGYEGYVMPSAHAHHYNETYKNKRIKSAYNGGYEIKISDCQYASLWDGKKKYFNRID